MNRTQLESKLSDLGVDAGSYSFGSIQNSDCVCIVNEAGRHRVYYVERDRPVELATFDSEEEANDFVHATFRKWFGAR